ncbi:hypothetical protein B296_00016001 [Ensete ventricosum]|uniref:Uncharacterized protein n=1 Tax=Ensete ventricosum TaxID=4639 RepID=A0A427A7K9_ENSVE|nr:hypothetical protein B296_00016001 [Ensete ventricosum]
MQDYVPMHEGATAKLSWGVEQLGHPPKLDYSRFPIPLVPPSVAPLGFVPKSLGGGVFDRISGSFHSTSSLDRTADEWVRTPDLVSVSVLSS